MEIMEHTHNHEDAHAHADVAQMNLSITNYWYEMSNALKY